MKTILILSITLLTSCVSTQSTYQPAKPVSVPYYVEGNWKAEPAPKAPTSYSVTPNAYGTGYNITPY